MGFLKNDYLEFFVRGIISLRVFGIGYQKIIVTFFFLPMSQFFDFVTVFEALHRRLS